MQDTSVSSAHQSSASGGISVSTVGGGASFSAQNGHGDGTYANVNEQAGIQAGAGGFDINVAGNTGLTGAVIASTADASKNSLTTGTLTFSDIQNQSHYDATSNGLSAGGSIGYSGKAVGPSSVSGSGGIVPMISQSDSGDQSGTTRSAIGAGTISLTNQAAQTQDVASLSRETSGANGAVSATPDVSSLLSQQADTMNAAQAAGQTVAQGIGAYADKKRDDALAAAKAADRKGDLSGGEADLAEADTWKEGGNDRVILQAAGGALIGGLGGSNAFVGAFGGAVGATLSAELAHQTKQAAAAVAGATGSSLLGNISGNILTGLGGALLGGSAGAAAASNVNLYNQGHDEEENLFERDEAELKKTFAREEAAFGRVTTPQGENSVPVINVGPLVVGGLSAAGRGNKSGDKIDSGKPRDNLPLGLGSTGRTVANSLNEQLAMQEVMSDPTVGTVVPMKSPMTDPRWPSSDGWVKMTQNVNGVEIHYVRNKNSGAIDDFKFK